MRACVYVCMVQICWEIGIFMTSWCVRLEHVFVSDSDIIVNIGKMKRQQVRNFMWLQEYKWKSDVTKGFFLSFTWKHCCFALFSVRSLASSSTCLHNWPSVGILFWENLSSQSLMGWLLWLAVLFIYQLLTSTPWRSLACLSMPCKRLLFLPRHLWSWLVSLGLMIMVMTLERWCKVLKYPVRLIILFAEGSQTFSPVCRYGGYKLIFWSVCLKSI